MSINMVLAATINIKLDRSFLAGANPLYGSYTIVVNPKHIAVFGNKYRRNMYLAKAETDCHGSWSWGFIIW